MKKEKELFTKEFYDKLKEVIQKCEKDVYNNTMEIEGYLYSKEPIGEWDTQEQFDAIENDDDILVNILCEESSLYCFVTCDSGGYVYLVIE